MQKYMLFLGLMMAVMAGGCSNTFQGAGQDIENMGEWIQDNT